jgi:hypothetical protein
MRTIAAAIYQSRGRVIRRSEDLDAGRFPNQGLTWQCGERPDEANDRQGPYFVAPLVAMTESRLRFADPDY